MHSPEGLGFLLPESLLVENHVGVPERGENPNLIEGVFFLLLVQVQNFHSLQGVEFAIGEPLDFVDRAVGPFA